MIQIHFSFWLALVLFFAMGMGWEFLMLFAAVTAHELSHVLVAKGFGCQVQRFHISALGEVAVVPQIERLAVWKRVLVIAAGPACNLFLWAASYWVFSWIPLNINFGFYNLVLAGFNLLPVFPLDGSRLLQLLVGDLAGILRANRWIIRAGRICSVALMALGMVQATLFFPNFTLLFMGFFLWRRSKSIWLELTGEFYIAMLDKPGWLAEQCPVSAKTLYAHPGTPIPQIVNRMGWSKVLLVVVPENEGVAYLHEGVIMQYVIRHGMHGTIEDIKANSLKERIS